MPTYSPGTWVENTTVIHATDMQRVEQGIVDADAAIVGNTTALAGKAATVHTHAESDVTNLTADLAAKANATHTHAESDVINLTTDLAAKAAASRAITAGAGLTGGGDLTADRTISMPNTGTAGTYGDATHSLTLTTDAQGRVTAVTANAISGGGGDPAPTITVVKTANYTTAANEFVPVDATSGAVTITFPTAPADGTKIAVKKVDASVNAVNLALGGSDRFNLASTGPTTGVLTLQNQALNARYKSSVALWYVYADDLPMSQLDLRYVLDSTATAKGDILAATGAGAITRLAVGSNTQVLTADSSQATGVKWAAAASGGAVPTFSSPAYLSMPRVNQGPGSAMGVAGNLRAYPLDIPIAVTVIAIGIEITTAVAGSTARLGIYSDVAGVPSALLLDAGTVSGAATGQLEASVASLALPAGRYWLTMVGQGTTGPTVRAPGGTAVVTKLNQSTSAATAFPNSCVFSTSAGTTGALPGTFGAVSISNGDNVGMVYLKVA